MPMFETFPVMRPATLASAGDSSILSNAIPFAAVPAAPKGMLSQQMIVISRTTVNSA